VTIRFFVGLSNRFNSRSAREVIMRLYINLAGVTEFFHNFTKRSAGFVFCFLGHPSYMQIFKQLFVLVEGKDHRGSLTVCICNVLNIP
jgi:hypothetical protein